MPMTNSMSEPTTPTVPDWAAEMKLLIISVISGARPGEPSSLVSTPSESCGAAYAIALEIASTAMFSAG